MSLSWRDMGSAPPGVETSIPVLVHAPLMNDGELIREVARQRGMPSESLDSADELLTRLADHDSVLVCSQEGLTHGLRERLSALLRDQPGWSRLPVVVILDPDLDNAGVMAELAPLMVLSDVIVLHRPMRPLAFTTAIDAAVTARGRQLQIRNHLDREQELRRELHHRVKNSFATLLAMYKISLRESESLEDLDGRFGRRAEALVAMQDVLDHSGERPGELGALAEAVLAPFAEDGAGLLDLQGEACEVGRRFAFSFGLILNELAANAAKYGALSANTGRVSIEWSVGAGAEGRFRFAWREAGGPTVRTPDRSGYGTRFIEASARGLMAEVDFDYDPSGLKFTFTAPTSALMRD